LILFSVIMPHHLTSLTLTYMTE